MNKEYVKVDGNLIVSDEEADRLSKEIHNEKKRRSGELNSWEYYSDQKVKYDNFKGKYIPFWLYAATAATLVAPPVALLMAGANPITTTFDTIFGTLNTDLFMTGITGAFVIPMASLMTYLDYQKHEYCKEKWEFANTQSEEHLKNSIKATKRIEELRKQIDAKEATTEKPKTYEKTFKVSKIEK